MPKSTSHAVSGPVVDFRGSIVEFVRRVAHAVPAGLRILLVWQQRVSERNRLSTMPQYLLRDMGLSPSDVNQETAKPFWKA